MTQKSMCLQLVGLLVTIQPEGLFGESAKFNFERYVDAEGTAIMNKISSTESFDSAKNVEFYKEWQNMFTIKHSSSQH